jgi:hypothetical protein
MIPNTALKDISSLKDLASIAVFCWTEGYGNAPNFLTNKKTLNLP